MKAATMRVALMLCSRKLVRYVFFKRCLLRNLCSSSAAEPNVDAEIRALSTQGNIEEALSLIYTHPSLSLQTYASMFHACAQKKCLQHGIALHHYILHHHPVIQNDIFLTNHIINMYCKCGHLAYARYLFDHMSYRNFVSWTALISGYAQSRLIRENIVSCTALISGYAQSGLIRECFSLFSGFVKSTMARSKVERLSGMQKQVLSLYRGFLRAARSKSEEERCKIESIISQEFRRNAKGVDRKNFLYIEYLLRRGNKQLDQLRNPGTTALSSLQLHSPSHHSNTG
ncbi:hypothetical protein VNO78_07628 [Psophocarpus tetragonolobus]|uniref:Complex 1 LYR protein domain-containing protein n=1 Tax=Psophocarpus tetragonolobus TaxID=3891 RepID=A0AAN9XSK4_PSOTE